MCVILTLTGRIGQMCYKYANWKPVHDLFHHLQVISNEYAVDWLDLSNVNKLIESGYITFYMMAIVLFAPAFTNYEIFAV